MPDSLFDTFAPPSYEDWKEALHQALRGRDPEETLFWSSPEVGLRVRSYFRREDLANLDHVPHARPQRPTDAPWQIAQEVDRGGPAGIAHLREALDGGAEALLFSADRKALLLKVIPTDVQVYLTHVTEEGLNNVEPSRHGAADVMRLAAQLAAGQAPDLQASTQRLLGHAERLPTMRLGLLDLSPYHEAGASAVQELGLMLALASEALHALVENGMAPDAAAQQLALMVPVSTLFFPEVAKLRALRLLWPQVLEAYGAEAAAPFVLATSSNRTFTELDRESNMLRHTTAGLAAVLGGCDAFAVRTHWDFVVERRLARGLQLVLRHESHLGHVADPLGGAYYVEELTDALARAGWAFFQHLEEQRGLVEAHRSGYVQRHLTETRGQLLEDVTHGRRTLLGTNRYPAAGDVAEAAPPESSDGTPTFEPLPTGRLAEPFEELRRQVVGRMRGALVLFGPGALRTARANFAQNVLLCGGFALDTVEADDPAGAARQAEADGAAFVVLCSSDAATDDALPAVRDALSDALLVVAGAPRAATASADVHLHRGQPLLPTLHDLVRHLGLET